MIEHSPRIVAQQFFEECCTDLNLSDEHREALIDCLADVIHADRIFANRGWRSRIQSRMAELQHRLTNGQNLQDLITEIRKELELP